MTSSRPTCCSPPTARASSTSGSRTPPTPPRSPGPARCSAPRLHDPRAGGGQAGVPGDRRVRPRAPGRVRRDRAQRLRRRALLLPRLPDRAGTARPQRLPGQPARARQPVPGEGPGGAAGPRRDHGVRQGRPHRADDATGRRVLAARPGGRHPRGLRHERRAAGRARLAPGPPPSRSVGQRPRCRPAGHRARRGRAGRVRPAAHHAADLRARAAAPPRAEAPGVILPAVLDRPARRGRRRRLPRLRPEGQQLTGRPRRPRPRPRKASLPPSAARPATVAVRAGPGRSPSARHRARSRRRRLSGAGQQHGVLHARPVPAVRPQRRAVAPGQHDPAVGRLRAEHAGRREQRRCTCFGTVSSFPQASR